MQQQLNYLITISVLLCISTLIILTESAQNKDDINAEIKKFQDKLESFEKPSPELIQSLIEQAEQACKTNRTFDENVAKNMSNCVENLFNQTALKIEFEAAIPKGELDDAFRKICLKWPDVKSCMKPAFDLIDECYEKGNLVNKGMDSMVEFFCGVNNDGALIALFLAEGGLNCLDQHGSEVRDCINEHSGDNQEDICTSLDSASKCAHTFKKCSDPTPENLISSMLRQVQKVTGCPVTKEALTNSGAADSSLIQSYIVNVHILILIVISILF